MKKSILLLSLFISLFANANMAQPKPEMFKYYTVHGNPFLSEYVHIEHEDLQIKIDELFEFAHYKVTYHINAEKDGIQIPFLFMANDFTSDFTVFIDGKKVEIKYMPQFEDGLKETKFVAFSDVYGKLMNTSFADLGNDFGYYVDLEDMLYFEADISKGKHVILVEYNATYNNITDGYINDKTFQYALAPAKYWKSFGTLDVTIDASAIEAPQNKLAIAVNLPFDHSGNINKISKWHFDSLPTNIIEIKKYEKPSDVAQFLIDLDATGLAYIFGFILIPLHLFLVYRYRKNNPTKKISIAVVLGSFIVPLILVLTGFIHLFLLQNALGDLYAKRMGAGLYFMVAFTYPIWVIVYGLIVWVFDRIIKKRINNIR